MKQELNQVNESIKEWIGWNYADQCWSIFDKEVDFKPIVPATPLRNLRDSFISQVLSVPFICPSPLAGCPISKLVRLRSVLIPLKTIPLPSVRTRTQFDELTLLSWVLFEKGGRTWLVESSY